MILQKNKSSFRKILIVLSLLTKVAASVQKLSIEVEAGYNSSYYFKSIDNLIYISSIGAYQIGCVAYLQFNNHLHLETGLSAI